MGEPTRWLRILLACTLLWATEVVASRGLAAEYSPIAALAIERPATTTVALARRFAPAPRRPRAAACARQPRLQLATTLRPKVWPMGAAPGFVLIERLHLRHSVILC